MASNANIFRVDTQANVVGRYPTEIELPTGRDVQVQFVSVTGEVNCCGREQRPNGPDGGSVYGSTDLDFSGDGLSSVVHNQRTMFIAGLFVKGKPSRERDRANEPEPIVYNGYVREGEESPEMNQIFYVGDGLTGEGGDGTRQTFYAPEGATHLLLGFADGGAFKGEPKDEHYRNTGRLNAEVKIKWYP